MFPEKLLVSQTTYDAQVPVALPPGIDPAVGAQVNHVPSVQHTLISWAGNHERLLRWLPTTTGASLVVIWFAGAGD